MAAQYQKYEFVEKFIKRWNAVMPHRGNMFGKITIKGKRPLLRESKYGDGHTFSFSFSSKAKIKLFLFDDRARIDIYFGLGYILQSMGKRNKHEFRHFDNYASYDLDAVIDNFIKYYDQIYDQNYISSLLDCRANFDNFKVNGGML